MRNKNLHHLVRDDDGTTKIHRPAPDSKAEAYAAAIIADLTTIANALETDEQIEALGRLLPLFPTRIVTAIADEFGLVAP